MRQGRQRFDIYKEWEGKKTRIQGIGNDWQPVVAIFPSIGDWTR